ncbi:hypothetical protein NCC49_005728 [Naganishia albida]|nr:hypothetical protein NCC49_005728 [Naganishia albida]
MPAADQPNLSSNLSAKPTLLQRLGFDYYYKPTNPIAEYIWRWWVWVAATFTLGMLEPIEVLALGIVFSLLTALFYLSLYKYFPAHFAFLRRRSAYYLYGDEAIPVFTLDLKSIFNKASLVVSWTKSTLGFGTDAGNYTSDSLKDVAKGVARAASSTASHVLSSTASTAFETAKAEL